jgi:uncharacterized Ntn-hydrolase superfamily protein
VALTVGISLALLLPATYSIVAVDSTDGTIGSAGASCVGSNVIRILGFVRGRGVVHAQAYLNPEGRDYAVAKLREGQDPADILASITARAFDPDAAMRQYGIADREGRHAAFTGAENGTYAGHHSGFDGRHAWSVQGNLLTGSPVLERTRDAFLLGACDLPERLLRAMEAGAENNEGDARCTPGGLPADSAFLAVISPDDPSQDLTLTADEAVLVSPIVSLRAQLEVWREGHPCILPVEDAGEPSPPDARASSPNDAGSVEDASLLDAGEDEAGASCQSVGSGAAEAGVLWLLLLTPLGWPRRAQRRGRPDRSVSPRPSTSSAPDGPSSPSVTSSLS